ncbi:adipocyte plasma membrane-associated protein-like protein 2 [Sarcoptes scabiei]|uniref:Adipocyte plasma membrane-associated protein-like protein 2 n=1 Tax=Sarcoptes scabiei TaxID=52283 RepID=A0A132AGP7_SARSC|nr:adipocyte plasma membrane-associated protein-like protein 2 [Sarcoptes scabiei]
MFCLFSSLVFFWLCFSFIFILYILLVAAEKLFDGLVLNPKSVCISEDECYLYTGSINGNIYQIDLDQRSLNVIANFPNGRPLGIRLFRNVLYFIEANTGLYSFDLETKSLKLLLALGDVKFIDGKKSKFFDDLVVMANDRSEIICFITDVSRKFNIDMWCYSYLEPDSSGRIIKFNVNTGSVVVILENLCFPNGIEITEKYQSLLICELSKRRILQYDLLGPESGKTSILIDNLPGEPENIRRSGNHFKETYWIGLALTRDYNNNLSFLDDYSTEPNLRKLILRSCFLLGMIMFSIGSWFHSDILKNKGSKLKSGLALILNDFINNPGMAIEIDLDGDIKQSFQIKDDTAVISEITESSKNNKNQRILFTTSSGGHLNRISLD